MSVTVAVRPLALAYMDRMDPSPEPEPIAVPDSIDLIDGRSITPPPPPSLGSDRFISTQPKGCNETITPNDPDFLSMQEWLQRCVAPAVGSSGTMATEETSPIDDRSHMRQVLLLTLIYHSSPYTVLRLILDELLLPPPPVIPAVFLATESSSDEEDGLMGSPVSASSTQRGKASSRPIIRSADVLIAKHSNLQPATDDPLLSISPMSSLHGGGVVTPSTSTSSGSVTSSTSVASTVSMPSSIGSPRLSPTQQCGGGKIGSMQSPPTSPPVAPVHVLGSPAHKISSDGVSTRPPPFILAQSSSTSSSSNSRPSAYALWHARKIHAFTMLHEWVRAFPQDFCCMPNVSTTSNLVTCDEPATKLLLEELLFSSLGSTAFPPVAWKTIANQHAASFHLEAIDSLASTAPMAIKSAATSPPRRSDPHRLGVHSHLSPELLTSFTQLAQILLEDYLASRTRYRGSSSEDSCEMVVVPSILSPSSASIHPSHQHIKSASAGMVVAGQAQGHHRAVSAGVGTGSAGGGFIASPFSPLSSPSSTTTPKSAGTIWSRSFGSSALGTAGTIEKNMDKEKIRRMMNMAPSASGSTTPSTQITTSPSTPCRVNNNGHVSPAATPLPSMRVSMAFSSPPHPPSPSSASVNNASLKFLTEFLATPVQAYASALTWLAIQRIEEIGECCMMNGGVGSDNLSSKKSPVGSVSYHHPAPVPSSSFLRLFLHMPPALSKRQMKLSNTMSCFVATSVLITPTVQMRKQVINHWLEMAEACLGGAGGATAATTTAGGTSTVVGKDGSSKSKEKDSSDSTITQLASSLPPVNFMHVFEIIYGLNHQSVYRLPAIQITPAKDGSVPLTPIQIAAKTQTVLPLLHKRNFLHAKSYEIYTRLTKLTSPNQNYKEYRKHLNEVLGEQQHQQQHPSAPLAAAVAFSPSQTKRTIIPYLGILLKDLTGIEEAGKPLCGILGKDQHENARNGADSDDEDESPQHDSISVDTPRTVRSRANTTASSASIGGGGGGGDTAPNTRTVSTASASSLIGEDSASPITTPTNAATSPESSPEPPPPTGSLPWDDSFLVRPRRNATLSGGRAAPMMSHTADDVDPFSSPSSASSSSSSIRTRPNSHLIRQPSAWSDTKKRESLLQMLTEEGSTGLLLHSTTPSTRGSISKSIPPPLTPKKSLLSAALPGRHQMVPAPARPSGERDGNASSKEPVVVASPVSESTSPVVLVPPSLLMLNHSKLRKIYSIVHSTLGCRLYFPSVPLDEEEEAWQMMMNGGSTTTSSSSPPNRTRSMTLAAHRYATQAGATDGARFAATIAELAVHAPGLVDLPAATPVSQSTPSSRPSSTALPFDRRLQHWLLSSMLTLTLKEESQLMERSYVIYPRKVAQPQNG